MTYDQIAYAFDDDGLEYAVMSYFSERDLPNDPKLLLLWRKTQSAIRELDEYVRMKANQETGGNEY